VTEIFGSLGKAREKLAGEGARLVQVEATALFRASKFDASGLAVGLSIIPRCHVIPRSNVGKTGSKAA